MHLSWLSLGARAKLATFLATELVANLETLAVIYNTFATAQNFDASAMNMLRKPLPEFFKCKITSGKSYRSCKTATAGSDVVQSGRPIFDDFFQHLWPYIGNNTANVVFQMVKRLWLIRIDQ
ncbi:hypothetical protein TNCV_2843971 [Trichonephila clavipes]|nr:hypothetical protein TNCV_2843971 [Trichonephila clavipes]